MHFIYAYSYTTAAFMIIAFVVLQKEGEENQFMQCQLCYDDDVSHIFQPCGHVRTCETCTTATIQASSNPCCPFCNTPIENVQRAYL